MNQVYDTPIQCCGCEACRQICPKMCITMQEDEKGFLYPVIDREKCVDCGMCRRVCLYQQEIKKQSEPAFYVYLHPELSHRLQSSSSGAFEVLCKAFAQGENESTVIFGCELNNELQAQHGYSVGFSEIARFKKSKYVQSRIGDSFLQVQEFLKQGKRVVFSGTPCQIYALKLFLKHDYDNLLLLDFVCHGVPSQKVFSAYIGYLEKKFRSTVSKYIFRNKKQENGIWSNLGVQIQFKNGKTVSYNASEDAYMSGFLGGLYNRDCCEACRFTSIKRCSDVTMGDFWGIGDYSKLLDERVTSGTSLLLANTEKGRKLLSGLSDHAFLEEVTADLAVAHNGQLKHPQKFHGKRDLFFLRLAHRNGFKRGIAACYPHKFGKRALFSKERLYANPVYIFMSRIKKSVLSALRH